VYSGVGRADIFNLPLHGGEWLSSCSGCFVLSKEPLVSIEDWVVQLDHSEGQKSSLCWESNSNFLVV
jgi:hypothetical protein